MAEQESKPRSSSPQDILSILNECCNYQAPALVLDSESGAVYDARLVSLSSESITLDVFSEQIKLVPKSFRYCVSFVYKGDSHAFFSAVLDYQHKPPPEPSHLIMEIPSHIVGIEARRAYRVPVVKDSKLKVRVMTKDGRSWAPTAIDLSLIGMLVEFSKDESPELTIGTEVAVKLQQGPDVVKIKGEVRRRSGLQYGLFFREVLSEQSLGPPEALRSIVSAVERRWLQERIR